MRVAIAGFNLESVSFLSAETTLEEFRQLETAGDALIDAFRGTETVMGGFIHACDEAGFDILPIVMTEAGARGPASDAAFEDYAARICDALAAARGQLDGVLLHLHGALTTPTRTDPDAEMAARVRAVIGPDMPMMLALDYHANLDAASIAPATAAFGYRYSPHVDMGDTGRRAGQCLARTLRGEIRPVTAIARPGLMVPSILSATALQPLADLVARARALPQTLPGIIDASLFAGFSYGDVPNCGFSVVVVADGDAAAAQAAAQALSADIDRARAALSSALKVYGVSDGLAFARARAADTGRPAVVLEHADRMNDSTHVLRAIVQDGSCRAAVPLLWDAQAARAACAAGAGAKLRLDVGGRSDPRAGGPVTIEAEVIQAGPTYYACTGEMRRGARVDLGLAALLRAGELDVIVTEIPQTCIDTDPFRVFGLDPMDYEVIVLRSKTHFRAAWGPLAAEIVIVDTPDWGPADLSTLPYCRAPIASIHRPDA
jgi:microcystin degradation protein MlrC